MRAIASDFSFQTEISIVPLPRTPNVDRVNYYTQIGQFPIDKDLSLRSIISASCSVLPESNQIRIFIDFICFVVAVLGFPTSFLVGICGVVIRCERIDRLFARRCSCMNYKIEICMSVCRLCDDNQTKLLIDE